MASEGGQRVFGEVPVPAPVLLEAMSEAVYVVDRRRRITYWNPAAESLTGFAARDVVGHRCRDGILNHVDDTGQLLCGAHCPLMATMRDGQSRRALVFAHHRDGHRVPVQISAAALRDDAGRIVGAVEVFHDDSPRRDIAEQLSTAEATALIDPLTGIGNRRLLDRALRQHQSDLRRYRHGFAILFADIDHFKTVNDTHGHDIGDAVLALVAKTIEACIRPSDTVGRWGGEEFLIIAPLLDRAGASGLAERLRAVVSTAWVNTTAGPVTATVSIGVSLAHRGDSADAVVHRADAALYQAKTNGRNTTVLA